MKLMFYFSLPLLLAACALRADATASNPCEKAFFGERSKIYSACKHGPDGALFLDPFLYESLLHLEGKKVLDAGCGTASWTIVAAKNGASVWGIDIERCMLDQAESAIKAAGVKDQVLLEEADVANLPFEGNFFDAALSVNVGCYLPRAHMEGLCIHVRELARVLKEEGTLVLTAPTSFGVVFTNGCRSEEEVTKHIEEVLGKIDSAQDFSQIIKSLGELTEIYRATFVVREGKLTLVTNENSLKSGERIWRKIPGLVVSSHYYGEEEYLSVFKEAGLAVEKIFRPCFRDEGEWERYLTSHPAKNERLGQAYIQHPPFVIYLLVKKK